MTTKSIITESIEKATYPLGPAWTPFSFGYFFGYSIDKDAADSVGNGEHIIRVTEDDGTYSVTKYLINRVEVARIRVNGEASTADTLAGIILLLAK